MEGREDVLLRGVGGGKMRYCFTSGGDGKNEVEARRRWESRSSVVVEEEGRGKSLLRRCRLNVQGDPYWVGDRCPAREDDGVC